MWRRRTHLLGGGGNKDCGATQPATALSAGAWRRFWARSGVCVMYPGRSSHRLGAGSDVVCALAALRLDLRRRSSLSSEQAPLHRSAGHSAVSWRVAAVLGTIRGPREASGAQQPSTWGWIRRDVRSCDASARSSSPQLSVVRTRTGAPLSRPQRCQLARDSGSGHDQGSVWGIRGAGAIGFGLDPT
jgi:hypothetical protein